jgi:hypothetical protein
LIVPTAQPQMVAASSYERPLALTSSNAVRWPVGKVDSAVLSSRSSISPSCSGSTFGSGRVVVSIPTASNFCRRNCE